jgi:hypothetical protein
MELVIRFCSLFPRLASGAPRVAPFTLPCVLTRYAALSLGEVSFILRFRVVCTAVLYCSMVEVGVWALVFPSPFRAPAFAFVGLCSHWSRCPPRIFCVTRLVYVVHRVCAPWECFFFPLGVNSMLSLMNGPVRLLRVVSLPHGGVHSFGSECVCVWVVVWSVQFSVLLPWCSMV